MAITKMAHMMNNFYTLREMFLDEAPMYLETKDHVRLEMCDQLISYANNCHQMTPEQTVEHVDHCWKLFQEQNPNVDAVAVDLVNEIISDHR